jgi:SAM-dependent methyltransferase
MRASEILGLADRAGIARGVRVLDLCCGTAGPGLFVTTACGCAYRGVDEDPSAIAVARRRAGSLGLTAHLDAARVPPVPPGPYDVVMVLETLFAFEDKRRLFKDVHDALAPGGRIAFTVEEGVPLTPAERRVMPGADTVWLTPLPELLSDLARSGFRLTWCEDHSEAHRVVVDGLVAAYTAAATGLRDTLDRGPINASTKAPAVGFVDDLVTSHLLWSRWLREGRARKLAVVAVRA